LLDREGLNIYIIFKKLDIGSKMRNELNLREISKDTADALKYIEINYKIIRNVVEIATNIGCNYNTLRYKFYKDLRITLEQYLINFRIKNSCELLESSDMLVKQIAYEVGFRDEISFIKQFKERRGVTPRLYRSNIRFKKFAKHILERIRKII